MNKTAGKSKNLKSLLCPIVFLVFTALGLIALPSKARQPQEPVVPVEVTRVNGAVKGQLVIKDPVSINYDFSKTSLYKEESVAEVVSSANEVSAFHQEMYINPQKKCLSQAQRVERFNLQNKQWTRQVRQLGCNPYDWKTETGGTFEISKDSGETTITGKGDRVLKLNYETQN